MRVRERENRWTEGEKTQVRERRKEIKRVWRGREKIRTGQSQQKQLINFQS